MVSPVVALSGYRLAPGRVSQWADGAFALPGAYASCLRRAGAVPLILPPPGGADGARPVEWGGVREHAEDLLGRVDALVLTGGGDLDPAAYGEPAHGEVSSVDGGRDRLELALASAAVSSGVPLLAVCRGMQVLNVALGGSLHQHLPELTPADHGENGDVAHPVTAAGASLLAGVCGERIEGCLSHHHQGVDRLGAGLVATGWADDAVVEALESPGSAAWLLAVQWHPERSAASDPVQQSLFEALVANARPRSASRPSPISGPK